MKHDIAVKWAEALRSENYRQGSGQLCYDNRDGEFREYCCLGVLCELYREEHPDMPVVKMDDYTGQVLYFEEGYHLPEPVKEWAGMKSCTGNYGEEYDEYKSLIEHNDNDCYSFEKIAEVILEKEDKL